MKDLLSKNKLVLPVFQIDLTSIVSKSLEYYIPNCADTTTGCQDSTITQMFICYIA